MAWLGTTRVIKPVEPAAVLHDGMASDAIRSRLSEGGVGHLVHADGARGGLIDGEGVPGQAPSPIDPGYRIAGTPTCAKAASSSAMMVAVEYSRKSGAYCQVSAGVLFIVALTGENISVGLRTAW
jgi:hypothetical protein